MKSTAEFVNTLEDVIRKRGAMDLLISDSAKVEISKRVVDILRALHIQSWQSEGGLQNQNFAEHRWHHHKRNVNWVMNWRDVPADAWLLCAQWVADVMNHTAEKSLGWRIPLQVLHGQTVDISILLCFMFWDVVYVPRYKSTDYNGQIGHNKSSEIRGRFVGFSWDVGNAMTFKVLTDDTRKVICRSRIRLAAIGENNLKLDRQVGAGPERIFIRSKRDDQELDKVRLPTIDMSRDPFTMEDDARTSDAQGEPPTVTSSEDDALEFSDTPHTSSSHRPVTRSQTQTPPVVETVFDDDDQGIHHDHEHNDDEPDPTPLFPGHPEYSPMYTHGRPSSVSATSPQE